MTLAAPQASRGGRAPLLRRWYFPIVSGVMFALTLIAFSDNLLTDVGQPSNSDPTMIIHGLFCGAWMAVLTLQSVLVARRDVARHRRLGPALLLIAVGVTFTTLYVFWVRWHGWTALDPEAKANRLLLPSYALAVWLGYRARRRPDAHRRLMLVGTFFMLGPVLARDFDRLIVPPLAGWPVAMVDALFPPYFALVWMSFFASLAWYDLAMNRLIHPITGWGALWLGIVSLIALTL